MIVDVLQENLLHALTKTSRIIPVKPQLPVLNNVLLSAKGGQLSLVASNLETTEVVLLGAKIEKDGGICVPARLLTELITSLPPETVHLVAIENTLNVTAGGVEAKIPGMDAGEFPPVSGVTTKKQVKLDRGLISGVLSKVLFAAANDEGRPLLTGVKITQEDDQVVFAATDGYRLAVDKTKLALEDGLSLVVPGRALAEVLKAGAEDKEAAEVSLGQTEDGQLVFTVGNTQVITRTIAGEYPNYGKIIPKTFTTRVLLDKVVFTRAIKSAAIFARDNANIVKLTILEQKVIISANTPQVGENRVEISAKVDGEGGETAFNSRFLLEFLNNFNEEELLFEITGSLNPGVFKSVKDENYLYVVMPVRVQG